MHTRQTLYQLSHRGSSAGQVESFKFFARQRPDGRGNSNSVIHSRVRIINEVGGGGGVPKPAVLLRGCSVTLLLLRTSCHRLAIQKHFAFVY